MNRIAMAVLALFVSMSAARASVVLRVDANGILTGAAGVAVNGRLYDVSFMDGIAGNSQFVNDSAAAEAAARALLDQVFLDVPDGLFDTVPGLTRGCGMVSACSVLTVWARLGTFQSGTLEVLATSAVNGVSQSNDVTSFLSLDPFFNTSNDPASTYATWSAHIADPGGVPEPGMLSLAGVALFGLFAQRRYTKKIRA